MGAAQKAVEDWLFEEFSSHLATVFETMAGERPETHRESGSAYVDDSGLRWRQTFTGVSGTVWVVATEPHWTTAGEYVLRAAGVQESEASSLKSTYLETIIQALSSFAQGMSGRLRREVRCATGEETADAAAEATWAIIRFKLGDTDVDLALGADPVLTNALLEVQPLGALSEAPVPAASKTFDLLLDVELPVSVSFGRAQVPLKQVLKLTTGSIIELNRSISEPVEVIVNNCVIARGEVVIVEGNFGVRIQQVISRQERLRTLN